VIEFPPMQRKRLWLTYSFLSLLGINFWLTQGEAQPNTVKKIADGVWFREGDIKGEGHCNNTIIEMKDYLIVVDANFPSGARRVMEDARKLSAKPVKYVFDTHHHGDHAYGNAVWTKQGAITLAFSGVAEEMKRYEPGRWQNTAASRKDVAELGLSSVEPPKETISKSIHTIDDGTRKVQFHFFGWAHTRGDGFVYLPKEKVLCTGDAAVNGAYNYTADANLGNWPKVMEAALKLDVAHVLPGHGPAGGKEILTGQRDFMIELKKSVSSAMREGKKVDDLAASVKLPDSVKNWVGGGLPAQLKDAYNEIEQKKPAGDTPHK
jgi:cyclase